MEKNWSRIWQDFQIIVLFLALTITLEGLFLFGFNKAVYHDTIAVYISGG